MLTNNIFKDHITTIFGNKKISEKGAIVLPFCKSF